VPRRSARPCAHSGCAALISIGRYCHMHSSDALQYDRYRGNSSARGYGGKWRTARLSYLSANPLCVMCMAKDIIASADVVDHIKPHRGDMVLFWDMSNWQSLCYSCHNSTKQREESR
jgi:5-methylcytosine-specific restriction enzyme A